MTNKPVRPKFEQEYLERKAAEQQKIVNTVGEPDKKIKVKGEAMRKNGGKGMNTILKICLSLGMVASVSLIVMGITTYQTSKDNSIKEASSIVQVQATDNTDKSNIEKEVDMTLTYQDEAKSIWSSSLVCNESEFINKYIQYRKSGLTMEQARDSLYLEYDKANQAVFNEEGEIVAEPTEMDTLINSEDENIEEEIVEQAEAETTSEETLYEVVSIEPIDLYAIQQVNVRKGPSAEDFDKIGSLSYGEQVTVNGVVDTYNGETVLWYQLSNGNFVSGAYLLEQLPISQPENDSNKSDENNNNTSTERPDSNNTTNSDANAKLNELMKSGEFNFNLEFTGQATVEGSGASTSINLQ